ncbi:MAG: hypothetical protein ACK526_11970 [Planctomyces sp.]
MRIHLGFLSVLVSLLSFSVMCPTEIVGEERQNLIVLTGAEGKPEYGAMFRTWADRWKTAAEAAGVSVRVFGMDPPGKGLSSEANADSDAASDGDEQTPKDTDGRPAATGAHHQSEIDLMKFHQALKDEVSRKSNEALWIVLIGHGTFDGRTAAFNLVGPDLTASQLAEWCRESQRPMNIVVCASSSAPFLKALSGPGRVIVTSTRDGNQVQFSRFGDAMSFAVSSTDADTDRDGQTSLLEAWQFAARRTADAYAAQGQLATEHSLLDDNGDGRGTRDESKSDARDTRKRNAEKTSPSDGSLASQRYLRPDPVEHSLSAEQRQIRDEQERQIEELRKQQATNPKPEEEYLREMEKLLLPLAEMYESLRKNSAEADNQP